MSLLPYILFNEDPLNSKKPDPDFEYESECAKECGFQTLLFSYEDLIRTGNAKSLDKLISATGQQPVIYRGWMLKPSVYEKLYSLLAQKNYCLINSPEQYKTCHYLPESLPFIKDHTPLTVFEKISGENNLEKVIERCAVFGNRAITIKDYVKSEKHHWETACFVPAACGKDKLRSSILRFMELRGSELNEGIVVREYVKLKDLAIHSKSGMPLAEEYRLFFINGHLLDAFNYWEEGDYAAEKPQLENFINVGEKIPSNFFTMDVAKKEDGSFIIMELGDGQVSGVPEAADKRKFFESIRKLYHS
jgi:hypothetical protein